jgi:hypothetical protein
MVPRAGALIVCLASAGSAGCANTVDYVAAADLEQERGSDAAAPGFRDIPPREPCMPGVYRGSFRANEGFLGLQGQILVTLTRSPSGEFFTVGRNSTLETPPDSNGATVSATIVGDGSCTTGDFVARMTDGEYRLAPGAEPTVPSVPFTGDVTGTYRFTPHGPALVGTWRAFLSGSLPDQPVSGGVWMAVLGVLPQGGE